MGSPVSPVIASIYKEYFESLAIPSSPTLIINSGMLIMSTVHQERSSQQTSRAPQFHRSTYQIHHRTPRNRRTSLPRYPNQIHFLLH